MEILETFSAQLGGNAQGVPKTYYFRVVRGAKGRVRIERRGQGAGDYRTYRMNVSEDELRRFKADVLKKGESL